MTMENTRRSGNAKTTQGRKKGTEWHGWGDVYSWGQIRGQTDTKDGAGAE